MVAAEQRESAFGGNLGFEQARVTAFFVDIVRIADNLTVALVVPRCDSRHLPDSKR